MPSVVNVAVPVGVVMPPLQATVAVKTTGWPGADGFADEVSVVPAPAALTVWVTPLDVDERQLLSPL
jgi:hypothetical protein